MFFWCVCIIWKLIHEGLSGSRARIRQNVLLTAATIRGIEAVPGRGLQGWTPRHHGNTLVVVVVPTGGCMCVASIGLDTSV
jgi:hypothetical protein